MSVSEFKEHVETDLPAEALTRILEDADADIIRRFGPHSGTITVRQVVSGEYLFLPRPASAVSSVKEIESDGSEKTLALDDYSLFFDGRALRRLDTGTNSRTEWASEVVVVYTPVSDTAQRKRVEIDLAILALSYKGAVKHEHTGDYTEIQHTYEAEREGVLKSLRPALGYYA